MSKASDIHRELLGAWNRRDFSAYRDLLHPEYTYTGGDGKELKGGPALGEHIGRMYAEAFPDGKLEITKVYAQGDTAIAEFVARGTHGGELMGIAPSGRSLDLPICNVIELRDGKVYREREYMDMMHMMVQIGAVKAPGQ